MGKVLNKFLNGYPGAVSRSADTVILSLRNASGGDIPFGAPVFLASDENACRTFIDGSSTQDNFLGFAVRAADKTPDTYGSNQAAYGVGDPVDVLVRGSVGISVETSAYTGNNVYIRKSDGKFVTSAGAEGSTVLLPNVTVRTLRDTAQRAEVVVTKRNLL